tara:strand:- start:621 stop:794 length:174 start_codon:yes stop_codon:yes gene_type:complete
MNITDAQYKKDIDGIVNSVTATINGAVWSVPLDPDNRHYAEILRQVKEEGLTIKDAD